MRNSPQPTRVKREERSGAILTEGARERRREKNQTSLKSGANAVVRGGIIGLSLNTGLTPGEGKSSTLRQSNSEMNTLNNTNGVKEGKACRKKGGRLGAREQKMATREIRSPEKGGRLFGKERGEEIGQYPSRQ